MKIIILAAGENGIKFPRIIDKPKCLYKVNGQVQLDIQMNEIKKVFEEKDIIIVTGYKEEKIREYLKSKGFKGRIKYNSNYQKGAVYSLLKGIEGEKEDVIVTYADEHISSENIKKISLDKKSMTILREIEWPYYSVGIFKLNSESTKLLYQKKYLTKEFFTELKKFLKKGISNKKYKEKYEFYWEYNSGVCIGFIVIDLMRCIGRLNTLDDIKKENQNVGFIDYNEKLEYIKDLDSFKETDEYKNSLLKKIYFNLITELLNLPKKIYIKYRIINGK